MFLLLAAVVIPPRLFSIVAAADKERGDNNDGDNDGGDDSASDNAYEEDLEEQNSIQICCAWGYNVLNNV